MRNKRFHVSSCLLLLFSCASKQNNDQLLKELSNSLASSTTKAHIDALNTIEVFKMKLADPVTHEKAKRWYPKLQRVQEASIEVTKLIEDMKQAVQMKTGLDSSYDGKIQSVHELLIDNGQYKELYKQLKQYRQQILLTDSMRLAELRNHVFIINKEQDTIDNADFVKECLTTNPPFGTLAFLNLLQNNLMMAKEKCIRYYNEQVMTYRPWFEPYEAILGQNAKILKAGDLLEVMGGVGSFSPTRLLQFSVNGKDIKPSENGVAVYKFKTSSKPGNYSLPVTIRLLDESGVEMTRDFIVEYTLVNAIQKY